METTLHQQLKRCYAPDESDTEVVLGAYRIDAVRGDELIEVQCAGLSAIRDKCHDLLKRHSLRVVKPVVARTRIAKAKKAGGPIYSSRMSPKRGDLLDIFEDLIYFTRVFPHRNLVLEVPMVHVMETRIPSKRRRRRWHKEYKVHDVELESISETHEFRLSSDLLSLVKVPPGTSQFNTSDLAGWIDRPRWVAQKIAYVLRHIDAIDTLDRKRSGIVYACKPLHQAAA
ncbi:hypothetical protein [Novipirellula artificiosorum]|uniref:DUF8091 domain-containing protein n=1 Tax=Novipirellula artificiosorum TaxID=2528016 RepID=A0A5C6DFA3_9BACT|nr:hypothetical protein [Novipirellula artificiosorum]TWU34421.1 hypothetical protein Poly41_45690 [Novipirellula artificiosorum]